MTDPARSDRFLLGCHLSIANGFPEAVGEAERLGNTALQLFTHSPSVWRMKPIVPEVAAAFAERRAATGIEFVVVHTMYLLNLASPDDALFERSVAGLIDEARRAALLGIDRVVTHLGAHKGAGLDAGIARIVRALDRWTSADASGGVHLLLENTAGSGTTIGSSFGEIASILESVSEPDRFGVCYDTCHGFAAGDDLRTVDGVDDVLRSAGRTIGVDRIEMIHLNDSASVRGARRDRHAHIGRGEIGAEGLAAVINHPWLRDLPFVLETPKELDGRPGADEINLAAVRSLRTEKEGA